MTGHFEIEELLGIVARSEISHLVHVFVATFGEILKNFPPRRLGHSTHRLAQTPDEDNVDSLLGAFEARP